MPFEQGRWGGFFFRLFRPLGKISYGLYLFHVPCVVLVSALYPWATGWPSFVGGFLAWFAVTILVSWICEAKLQAAILSFYKARRRASLAR
jgi:peptidoglycan/LPS O-acetylase OafA/YrhL